MSGPQGGSSQETVELRVHGVSGTPAEDMLDCPTEFLRQEAGDKHAGFYRCRPCDCDDENRTGGRPVREAYSWGGLTSGSATRALWLLFLPFILVNLAHWMLPPSKEGREPARAAVTWMRLIALSLSLTLMLAAVQVAVDIVGWQCMAVARCSNKLGPLSGLVYASDGTRVAVSALPVALMLGMLLFLGRANPGSGGTGEKSAEDVDFDESMGAVDEAQPQEGEGALKEATPDSAVLAKDVPLKETNFWSSDPSVRRLRACHVMAWATGLGAVILFAPVRYLEAWHAMWWACVILFGVNVAVLLASIAFTWATPITARGGPSADEWDKRIAFMKWSSVALLAATLIVVGCTKTPDHPPTHLPGLRYTVYGLLATQGLMLIALFAATARCMNIKYLRRGIARVPRALVWPAPQLISWLRKEEPTAVKDDGWAPTLNGFAAPLLATIAVLAAGGFSTGIGLWSAQYLGSPVPSTKAAQCLVGFRAKIVEGPNAGAASLIDQCNEIKKQQAAELPSTIDVQIANYDADTPLIVPPAYFVAALVFFGLLVTLVGAGLLIWFVAVRKWTTEARTAVEGDYLSDQDNQRIRAIARSRAVASLTDFAPSILARLTGLAVLSMLSLGVPFTFIYFAAGFDQVPITVPVLSNLSVASISATAAGVVAIAAVAFRNRKQRRVVGILWDVITFWPRANHPLTPPCYAQRTVPDLKNQLKCLTPDDGKRVVLAAHSQGTIIAAATLLQEDVRHSDRVALLTFGCPLRRLYGRNFPAYFGKHSMDYLADKQKKQWLNLWSATDPIGAWVFKEGEPVRPTSLDPLTFTYDLGVIDHRLLDIVRLTPRPRGMDEPICGHSGFWTRDEYQGAVDSLIATRGRADGIGK
jgi:hypothetical protein